MKKLLLHLDTDISPSTFDQVVAYDSNVDNIIAYGGITVDNVTSHVHGMIFTRSVDNLKNSAIFIGGSNVSASDLVGAAVKRAFFGPIVITSRDITRSTAISLQMKSAYGVNVTAGEAANDESVNKLLNDAHVAIACGPPGVCVIPQSAWESNDTLEVVADVNAVPPQGIAGLDVMDNGTDKKGIRFYGALTIGNFKMKVHRAAIKSLYESNNQFLNESTIYDIACKITSK